MALHQVSHLCQRIMVNYFVVLTKLYLNSCSNRSRWYLMVKSPIFCCLVLRDITSIISPFPAAPVSNLSQDSCSFIQLKLSCPALSQPSIFIHTGAYSVRHYSVSLTVIYGFYFFNIKPDSSLI